MTVDSLRNEILLALAHGTRFNLTGQTPPPPASPKTPFLLVLLRGLLGCLYALAALLLLKIFHGLGALLATFLLLLLHAWLTDGRENRVPLLISRKLLAQDGASDFTHVFDTLLCLLPCLLLFLLLHQGQILWLPFLFSFSFAGALEIAGNAKLATGDATRQIKLWQTALWIPLAFFLLALLFGFATGRVLLQGGTMAILLFLLLPWLKRLPNRPAGPLAANFLCLCLLSLMVLLLTIV